MAPNAPPPKPALGVSLAYDVAAQNLAGQLSHVDTLNTRLAGVVAATIGVAALSIQATIPQAVRAFTVVWLVGAIIETALATRARDWMSAPNPQVFYPFAGYEPDYMKQLFLPDVLAAIRKNRRPLAVKTWRLNWAIVYVGLALLSMVIGKVIAEGGLSLLWSTLAWLKGL